MWGITSSITDAARQAPLAFAQGVADIFIKPPQKMVEMWQGLSPEDQELFKKAALAGARLAAKMLINKGGKVEF